MIKEGRTPDREQFIGSIDLSAQGFERDLQLLTDMAEFGMPVHTEPDFILSTQRGRQTKAYQQAQSAVNVMMYEGALKGVLIILDAQAVALQGDIHLQHLTHIPSKDKPSGRVGSNCSSVSSKYGGGRY